jgi:hypothetical protein
MKDGNSDPAENKELLQDSSTTSEKLKSGQILYQKDLVLNSQKITRNFTMQITDLFGTTYDIGKNRLRVRTQLT